MEACFAVEELHLPSILPPCRLSLPWHLPSPARRPSALFKSPRFPCEIMWGPRNSEKLDEFCCGKWISEFFRGYGYGISRTGRPYIITPTLWIKYAWQNEKVNRTLNTQAGFISRLYRPPRHDRIFAYPLPEDKLRIFILKDLDSFGQPERTKRKISSRAVS